MKRRLSLSATAFAAHARGHAGFVSRRLLEYRDATVSTAVRDSSSALVTARNQYSTLLESPETLSVTKIVG